MVPIARAVAMPAIHRRRSLLVLQRVRDVAYSCRSVIFSCACRNLAVWQTRRLLGVQMSVAAK